ncbi:lysozyme inhibitor LprI family protein [Oxalobacteraceae bacterium A2-2]
MFATSRLLALVLAGVPLAAAAQYPNTSYFGVKFDEDEAWYQQCKRVEKLPMPAAAAAPAGCNAVALYYTKVNQAVTSQAEWDQVRACASAQGDHAVLAMLYANGLGVPRSRDLAIQQACQMEHVAKAEMESRIDHLAALPDGGKRYDQCDDITSGYMGGVCAAISEGQKDRVRHGQLEKLAGTLSPAGKAAFTKLRAAAHRYAQAGAAEVDRQGTAASQFMIEREARLDEEFAQAALDTGAGLVLAASPEGHARRDRELNEVYQSIMTARAADSDHPGRIGDSTIERSDVRDAERLWLAYRDAFVAFAATLPGAPDALAIKTLLTAQRITILRDVAAYR